MEVLFSSFVVQACEQLQHLKEILNPLIELSATLDSAARNPAEIFRATSAKNQPITGIYTFILLKLLIIVTCAYCIVRDPLSTSFTSWQLKCVKIRSKTKIVKSTRL